MTNLTQYRRITFRPTNDEPHLGEASHLLPGLTRLAELFLASRARGEDVWRGAVCASDVSGFGLTLAELRLLVAAGLVEASASRGSLRGTPRRGHVPAQLGPRTLLILSEAGLAYVTRQSRSLSVPAPVKTAAANGDPARVVPYYDADARELDVAGVVILCLPVQARSLAAVLGALELSGWNRRVARPLTGCRGGNDHHHLANVALRLNRHQAMIDFRTDDGAICWTWRPRRGAAGCGG